MTMDASTADNSPRKRNPNILQALDPMHRSLLTSNLRYEQDADRRSSADDQSVYGNDSDEYYTPLSTIVSTDSGTDCGAISRHADTAAPMPARKHKTDMVRGTGCADAGAHTSTKHSRSAELNGKHQPKQTSNVSSTQNRCSTNAVTWAHGLRRSTGTIERSQPPNGPHRSKASRCSGDSVARAVPLRHSGSSASAKRKQRAHASKYSDSSDINSEANLVIENMRNRECEMFRKISFNNGYFSTTGSSSSDHMYCTSDTNTVESTGLYAAAAHCRHLAKEPKACAVDAKPAKTMHRRKCRSFPLANGTAASSARAQHDTSCVADRPQRPQHIDNYADNVERSAATQTNTIQNTRKITITIKTNAMPAGVSVSATESKRVHSNRQLSVAGGARADALCESSADSESSNGDSGGEHCASTDSSSNCQAAHEHDARNGADSCDESSSDGSSSFFSLSSSEAECVSEPSQYFNCMSFSDLNTSNDRSTECIGDLVGDHCDDDHDDDKKFSEKMAAMPKPILTHEKRAPMAVAAPSAGLPMILIEQQLSEDRVVTSTVKVDKKQIKQFKSALRKRLQGKRIVDNSFSEEIFDKTIHLERQADVSCSRELIDSIVLSLEAQSNACQTTKLAKPTKAPKAERPKFVCDDFLFDKLHASPKCTGKSISRLLAHRLEHQTITSIRRNLLHNVAYAITEKDRQTRSEKRQLAELPPIKPPRSFVASASSSPLSKQSFESSATVPIAELNKIEVAPPMGFVVPVGRPNALDVPRTKCEPYVGEAHSVHFGWSRPQSNFDNDSATLAHYVTAEPADMPSHQNGGRRPPADTAARIPPKEDIDTVDSARNSNHEFAQFTANLNRENRATNYSTPIKLAGSAHTTCAYASPPYESGKVCDKCHCSKSKSPKMLSSKTGRKIGKAALKRTKTLIGTSKKFLKKPLTKQPAKHDPPKAAAFKGGDTTACNNCDTTGANGYCDKRVDKSLNLTPTEADRQHVALHDSPTRTVNLSRLQLLQLDAGPRTWTHDRRTDAHTDLDGELYMTPMEEFDFERVVAEPATQPDNGGTNKNARTLRRSPSKVISMLAKSSVNFFRPKQRADAKHAQPNESPHYYRANDYDELDNKVLLMNEVLAEMRKRIEMGQGSGNEEADAPPAERPSSSSAKKCLFRERAASTSSGDLLEEDDGIVEKVTRIDLHDEPEPVYAEIMPQQSAHDVGSDTLYRSCLEDSRAGPAAAVAAYGAKRGSVELREVYINASASSAPPNKYIMVNNDPKILYATVNRSHSRQSTEQRSVDVTDARSADVTASFESLDTSLIDDFAKSVQIELDQCRHRIGGLLSTANAAASQYVECDAGSHSGSESLTASDMNSGCSSFYRRSRQIVGNHGGTGDLIAALDAMSFDTIASDSYCESINRGNDLNSEIKDTITSLENMPSSVGESSSLSHDFMPNDMTFRTCRDTIDRSYDSNKFLSFQRQESDSLASSSPGSSLYRTGAKNDASLRGKAKGMSPKLQYLKSKLRKSLRLDGDKSARDKTIFEDCVEPDSIDGHSMNSRASRSSAGQSMADAKRQQMFESICRQIKGMPSGRVDVTQIERLIDVIRQQQTVRAQVQSALDVCRSTGEFHNSRELIEAEQLMLMTCLKECAALEQLITLWQDECGPARDHSAALAGLATLTIKHLEFRLTSDSIFDAHFTYFYLCVCTYRDQVAFTIAKERTANSIVFDNVRLQFTDLAADFQIRVEVFALRLRKLARTDKAPEAPQRRLQCQISRFRLQGKAQLNSVNLSRLLSSSAYQSPQKLERLSCGRYSCSSHGLISPTLVHCGQGSTLGDSLRIGYHEQLLFSESNANGFLNIADASQKWDRLWCRIDGFAMNFWKYPQDRADDTHAPIVTLNLIASNHRDQTLLVDREICAKPRTFKIDMLNVCASTADLSKQRVQTYFIAAESQLDLELWLGEIQRIYRIIESWNVRSHGL